MKKCPHCGYENENNAALQCPQCNKFYSKIIELIEQEVADEEQNLWRTRWVKIWQSPDKKEAFKIEYRAFIDSLSLTAKFTFFVIATFIFALIVTVL